MELTIEEANAAYADAKKFSEDFIATADRSWQELKKRGKDGKLLSETRLKPRFPLWHSTFKIRQPIIFSRIPIPIGLDTTQDGRDGQGARAAVLKERLSIGLIKDTNFFDTMSSARDDFLATNFGQCRVYFRIEETEEKEKIYLQPAALDPETQQPIFLDPSGVPIPSEMLQQDSKGIYLESDDYIKVSNERIILEPVFYKNFKISNDVTRWDTGSTKQVFFENYYSKREFVKIYGKEALETRSEDDKRQSNKAKGYTVVEMWDELDKKVVWFLEGGTDFIKPKSISELESKEGYDEEEKCNIYKLSKFFPCPPPLIVNQSTDEFWPTPEHYQVSDLLETANVLFLKRKAIAKAIKAVCLYDNNVEGLKAALSESATLDAYAVTNLSQALAASGGTLEGVVQYLPINNLVQSLDTITQEFAAILQDYYQQTGTSDLLRGLTDSTERTFGEQQLKEKYALNQIATMQYKMQEFAQNTIELMCEMALKNFSDETLARYIMPETLDAQAQATYQNDLKLLQDDRRGRFRVELQTDSMIAMNEAYDIQMRKDLVNSITAAIEKTNASVEQAPSIASVNLHAMKYLIQGFRQSKLFQAEITKSIDDAIQISKQNAEAQSNQPPPFDKDAADNQLAVAKFEFEKEMKVRESQDETIIQSQKQQIEMLKIEQAERLASIETQLLQMKQQGEQSVEFAKLQQSIAQINAEIELSKAQIEIKREELMIKAQDSSTKAELEQFRVLLEKQIADDTRKMSEVEQALNAYKVEMDEKEKLLTEQRLQSEHQFDMLHSMINLSTKNKEIETKLAAQSPAPNITVQVPTPKKSKKITTIIRGEKGEILGAESKEEDDDKNKES
jgi:hypothetical protein